jgi:PAS domain S-box-containing protein
MQANGQTRAGVGTGDGIVTVDEQGAIESANLHAARIFGYNLEELTGLRLSGLLPALASDRLDHRLAPYLPQPAGGRRLEGRHKNGTLVPLEIEVGEARLGERRLFTLLLRDLTAKGRATLGDEDCDWLAILLDNLPDSIYFKDTASRFILVNRALGKRFGLSDPAAAIGKTDFDFFLEEHARQAFADEQEMIRSGRPIVGLEEKETWPDGRVTWASTTKMPLCDKHGRIVGTFGMSRDITDRKLAEAELRRLSRFLDSIVDHLPIMLFVKDAASLRFERLNQAGEELLGLSREQILGRNDYDFFPKAEADFFIAKDRDVLDGKKLVDIPEEEIVTRHGKRILHTRKIPLIDEHGQPTHLVGISEDITLAKEAEVALQKAKQAAESASRSKSEFLANVSHEMRTPMNGIIGMTELALDTDLKPEQREFLNMVKASADALLDVINDILDFSKIEAGKLDLEQIPFPMRDSLGDTMKTLALRAHKKGLELACDVHADVPDNLVGDPGRLRQVIVNLVGNAIKFTEHGEVVVSVSRLQIADRGLQIERSEENVQKDGVGALSSNPQSAICNLQFSVTDTGIGIPRNRQQAIFAPFVQADGSTTRKYGGTGLGLAISASLVELMGGRIWVESESGRGSTFHFTARFGVATGPVTTAQPSRPAKLDSLPVLVVDDNATNRRILEEILTNWHMKPKVVQSARLALEELQRAVDAGQPYPLVLLDALMPEMDGYMLAQKIQEHPHFGGTIIMMLSSADSSIHQARDLGVAAALMKPIKQSELFDAIMTSLGMSLRGADRFADETEATRCARPLRILLAEDNAVNQKLAVCLLEKRGHAVTLTKNGKEALAALECDAFDIVLMDVQMPEMDGFEATAAIRSRERATGGHLPIIAMTAHAMKGDREKCLEMGMDGYVSKPLQARDLFDVVEKRGAGGDGPGARHEGRGTRDEGPEAWNEEREPRDEGGNPQSVAPLDSPLAPPPSSLIDIAAALQRTAGDRELLRELAEVFCSDCSSMIEDIGAAFERSDAKGLREAAHALKGAVGVFGPSAAFETAFILEKGDLQGDLNNARPIFQRLREQIDGLLPSLQGLARGEGL